MGDRALAFVQFPHPGGEHSIAHAAVWNPSHRSHGRKFLLASGEYVDRDETVRDKLVFWGEWEPPSTAAPLEWNRGDSLPRSLQQPFWGHPPADLKLQNTDPWVWGDRMIYSNCKQTMGVDDRPTAMQRLARGSVICFGSTIQGTFCLDTVFVIASYRSWSPIEHVEGVGAAFHTCTARALVTNPGPHLQTTLYFGATFDDQVEGMYSFVPALRAEGQHRRFKRPTIELSGLIRPDSTQSVRGPNVARSIEEVRGAWESVRNQVTEHHLAAVRFDIPPSRGELGPTLFDQPG